ncbi:MAG TPA: hypothetical protein VJ022_08835 [Anaerolineales bacterium]|nr:hypothetical protein [Anaerolineales bacterium]
MNPQGTPIALPLRLWLGVEVLFGIGAVLAIGVSPADSATNFAWPIQPVVMAAVLGAFYMSSALLFLLPLFAKRWEMIRVMILPTALFATVQLIATFLHWDKFSVGTTPFYVWFASYLLPPPIFVTAYLWHQRRASPQNMSSDSPLPVWMRALFWISGIGLILGAMTAFILPSLLIPNFPWQLTPLTARSLCGWIMILGVILIAMARENDRARVRFGTPFLILILPTLFIQMSRYTDQVNWSNPVLWISLIFLAVICVCGIVLATGNWQESLR